MLTQSELVLSLYDGAIKFAENAKTEFEAGNDNNGNAYLVKSKKIVVELLNSLNEQDCNKNLYDNMCQLYNYIYIRLVEANINKDTKLIDEALQILRTLRNAWSDAIKRQAMEN